MEMACKLLLGFCTVFSCTFFLFSSKPLECTGVLDFSRKTNFTDTLLELTACNYANIMFMSCILKLMIRALASATAKSKRYTLVQLELSGKGAAIMKYVDRVLQHPNTLKRA